MAFQGPLSAMEGTNGKYEFMNGRLGDSPGTFGKGTVVEDLVEPADFREYPAIKGMETVLLALEGIDKLCANILKKFQTPEGPGSSESAVPHSTEKTAPKSPPLATAADNFKQKQFDGDGVIDLTSSRKSDQGGPYDAEQGHSSALASIDDVILISSDDEEDEASAKWSPRSPQVVSAIPQVKVDDFDKGDPLAHMWAKLQFVKDNVTGLNHEGAHGFVEETNFPQTVEACDFGKRRKVMDGDDVSYQVNYNHQSTQWAWDNHELLQVEPVSVSKPRRARGRPRKDDSFRKEETSQVEPVDLLEFWPKKVAQVKHIHKQKIAQVSPMQVEVNVAQVSPMQVKGNVAQVSPMQGKEKGAQVSPTHAKEKVAQVNPGEVMENLTEVSPIKVKEKTPGKGETGGNIRREMKGKRKMDDEGLLEEEVDEEEEECGKPGVLDLAEELIIHSTKLNNKKVDYEPYVRETYLEEEDELENVFMEMKIHQACHPGSSSDFVTEFSGKDWRGCDHKNFDFEDGVGYYCEDCGTEGIEIPTSESSRPSKSGCAHRNYEFTDEAGIFCPDCGKVFQDIQSYYVASDKSRGSRKGEQKVQDKADGPPRVQLNLQDTGGTEDFRGIEMQLHPFFEEKLHPHQKRGFQFLNKHLLGGQQPNNEAMGCVLSHSPGTGKTCLVISFIQSFLTTFPNGKPLILAPKIMLQTWENQFKHWQVQKVPIFKLGVPTCGRFPVDGEIEDDVDDDEDDLGWASQIRSTVKEERAIKLREWQASRGVLLMSYKLFSNVVMNGLGDHVLPESLDYQMSKVLLEATNLVILDEGHLARNENAQITKALLAMETKRKVVLSGTLFHNTFKELYTVLKLCRHNFMTSHPEYGKRIAELAAMSNRGSDISFLRAKSQKELMQIEQKIFTDEIGDKLERYVKDDQSVDDIESVIFKLKSLTTFVDWYPGGILKELPGLHEYSVHLNLTESQWKAINSIPDKVNHMSKQCAIVAACIHPCLMTRVDQLFAGPKAEAFDSEKHPHRSGKIVFLLKLIQLCKTAKEKLVIFCSTLEPLRYVEKLFCDELKWKSGQHVMRLDGKMQDPDRQRVIVEFNEKPQGQVLLASTKACKEGITLVGASRVVVLDCPDNPSVVRQAVSRAFRIGQTRPVYVYRLVSTNTDELNVFKRSVNKERLSQVLSDPESTIGRLGEFLQEQGPAEVKDVLLKEIMSTMADQIDVVQRYNAMG